MNVTEEPIAPSLVDGIEGSAEEGAELAGVSVDAEPEEIVAAIDRFVSTPPKKRSAGVDNWTERALPLGSLWGRQLARRFGWEWASVTLHDQGGMRALGVFPKDRSLAVYPWHFVFGCLENQAPVTILLAFNMLAAGKVPAQGANAYVNLMEGVRHIVPPA